MLEQSFGKGRVPREDRSLTQGSSDFRKALAGTSRFFLWIWGGGGGGGCMLRCEEARPPLLA